MLHKVGYEVVYHDGAFKTPSYPSRKRHWNPEHKQLLEALDLARNAVLARSEGDWIVVIKSSAQGGFRTDDIMAKLVVYVPVQADQRAALLEALSSFEDVIAERLEVPVDTTYRSIESPACIVFGGTATWVRTEHRDDGQLEDKKYFCETHYQEQSTFDHSKGHPNISWEQLEPTST